MITIYHNPQCGTSRNVLELIRKNGIEPTIIEYLKTPPNRETLHVLLKVMNFSPRQLLRTNVVPYTELKLDAAHSDEFIIDSMLTHPLLINRPIVVTPKGTRLCRPSETVLELL